MPSSRILVAVATSAIAFSNPVPVVADEGIQCGVASAVFSSNTATAATAVKTGKLDFWWNWNTVLNIDTTGLDAATVAAVNQSFGELFLSF